MEKNKTIGVRVTKNSSRVGEGTLVSIRSLWWDEVVDQVKCCYQHDGALE